MSILTAFESVIPKQQIHWRTNFALWVFPMKKMKNFALLNGRNLDQVVPGNTLLKVVEKGH